MRTATTVELSGSGSAIADVTVLVVEAQKLGLDVCWVAEAWGAEVRERAGSAATGRGRPPW